jgi:hypothetical protein
VLEMIIVVITMVMWQHPSPFYQSFHTSSKLRKHIPDKRSWLAKATRLAGEGHGVGSDLAVDRLGRDDDFLQRTQGLSLLKQAIGLCRSALP